MAKRAETSDRIKDWERERKAAESVRREGREETGVGDRLRTAVEVRRYDFAATPPEGKTGEVVVDNITVQQARGLTRIFEADGYTVTSGRAT